MGCGVSGEGHGMGQWVGLSLWVYLGSRHMSMHNSAWRCRLGANGVFFGFLKNAFCTPHRGAAMDFGCRVHAFGAPKPSCALGSSTPQGTAMFGLICLKQIKVTN